MSNIYPTGMRGPAAAQLVLLASLAAACSEETVESEDRDPISAHDIFPRDPKNHVFSERFPEIVSDSTEPSPVPGPAWTDSPVAPEPLDDELRPKGFLRKTEQSNAEMFQVAKGQADVVMRPISTHICFLTRLSGELAGGGSGAAVHHNNTDASYRCPRFNWWISAADDTGPVWKLGACQRAPGSLDAEATCVPGSDFVGDPGAVILGSNMGAVTSVGCPSAWTNMWTGHAVTFLSMIAGEFNGGGEYGEVIYSPVVTNPTQLKVGNSACRRVEAGAYSLFVGVPGQMSSRIPYAASAQRRESRTVKMQRTRDAVCYLTKVSGDFNGAPERVKIYPQKDAAGVEYWMLEAHAERGSAYAHAECIPYNQRTPIVN